MPLSQIIGRMLLAAALAVAIAGGAWAQDRKTGPSGQPLPRFVSLKADEVNVRRGPGWEHGVAWVFRKAGLPVEIIAEFDVWRQVRDSEGSTGWVLGRLLSARRTALVAPWSKDRSEFALYEAPTSLSPVKAKLQAGVLADILSCDEDWCNVAVGDVKGWIEQDKLFGVYPNELIE